ncbi:ABC transporter ATP-binding protein [Shimia sp. R11_0]|uniref:ABC transporter ATP-binding protein n=1 Tax=Shimia sp. R11_0 TaxID=2821096 RepID=UPI001ADB50AB|nr:ABC transporter ATP-binding protein [Shimia sp. R11_0]MBO9476701.1 ABC transporter ATP-binding protein [Shimia sp. R11_0]
MRSSNRLQANTVSVAFQKQAVLNALSLSLPDGKMTVIVGPNACGKSTLLRALSRLQKLDSGQIVLDGKSISSQRSKQVARELAVLPQSPAAPEGLSVHDLVRRGRTPHQSVLQQWSTIDQAAVARALELTGMTANAHRALETLSGGQRQRAWIAMALAQDTDILLLDEPTTYLDLPHQIELLTLVQKLNQDTGRTVAMVLHDINLAARFADHIVALKNGTVHIQGSPEDVVTEDMMSKIFNLPSTVIKDPVHGHPHVIPK